MSKKLKKNVPVLRFPEFEGDWNATTLGKLSDKPSYGLNASATKFDGKHKYIRITDIDDNTRSFIPNPLTSPDSEIISDYKLQEKDIVFARTGASVGKSYLYNKKDGELYFAGYLIKFSIKKADPNFVYYQTLTDRYLKYVMATSMRSGQPGINAEEYSIFPIYISSIAEQEKIASFLGAIANRLTQLRRKQELLQTYKRGVMQKIFSQQIRFKQDDGSDFPAWQKKKLGEIADFSKGKGISKDDLCNSGNLKCIRYAELYTSYNEVIKDAISSTNLSPKNLILSQKNDVIIPSSGETAIDMAKAACVNISGIALGGDLTILRTNINGIFLAYYLNHYKKIDIAKIAQGASVVHLYSSQLKSLSIEIPLLEEQQKIVDFLTTIDQKIEAVEQQIDRTEQFKKGLLQKMFI